MLYKVNKQYARGSDIEIAAFKEITDAKLFMQARLIEDAKLKMDVTYRLLEGSDVLEELGPGAVSQPASMSATTNTSSGGAQQGSGFQPTPFNTGPRPPGMPSKWQKDEGEK